MKIKRYLIWIIFSLFLLLHLLPYFNNTVPLGYDSGEYLHIFKTFPNLSSWLEIGFSPGLFAFVYPLIRVGISPQSLLIPLSIFSQIILFFSIYFVVKKIFDEKTALFSAFIFTISAIQYRTFWYFYVKNTFALAFLIVTLYFFNKKLLIPSLIFTAFVAYFHLPTFLILFLIVIIEIILNSKDRFFYLKIFFAIFAVGIYYLYHFNQLILPFLMPIFTSVFPVKVISGLTQETGGSFYPLATSLLLVILYLPFSFYGVYEVIKNKINFRPFTTGLILLFLMIFTKFFFYQRFFIAFDIFLIVFAGIGFNNLLQKYKDNNQAKDILNFYPVVLVIFIFAFVFKTSQPLINKSTFSEIKYFGQQKKSGYILSTSKEDSAWLLGYTNLPVIANSYGGYSYHWNTSQWKSFVSGPGLEKEIKLLKLLPTPLYIFISDKSVGDFSELIGSKCLKNETMHFYRFDCK